MTSIKTLNYEFYENNQECWEEDLENAHIQLNREIAWIIADKIFDIEQLLDFPKNENIDDYVIEKLQDYEDLEFVFDNEDLLRYVCEFCNEFFQNFHNDK